MKNLKFVILAASALTISACTATQEQFDFSKKAPDEFAVVTRAPLEMPPNFNLRPPRPGVQRPQEATTDDAAQQAVFGTEKTTAPVITSKSSGEDILLQKSGAAGATSAIRDVVDQESAVYAKENTSTVNKILGKAGKKIDTPATVVDAKKESERIIQNKKEGKPVTEGETPTIQE